MRFEYSKPMTASSSGGPSSTGGYNGPNERVNPGGYGTGDRYNHQGGAGGARPDFQSRPPMGRGSMMSR